LTITPLGGYTLGLVTALLGRSSIWVCTNAIESTVLQHLQEQLAFLHKVDPEAYSAVYSIKSDEEIHQQTGVANQGNSVFSVPVFLLVKYSTAFAIWLSTKL